MSRFLERVLIAKDNELRRLRIARPLEDVARQARTQPVRDFQAAIRGGRRIIAEIKRCSPSVAAFRQTAAPAELARTYATSGAAAISIVTDATNFGTSLADVAVVRAKVSLPVLVKDFVIDPYQIFAARAAGADALLLIARILTPQALRSLLVLCQELLLTPLVECHDESDLAKAVDVGAGVIGINNRDLDTLTVSLATSERLLPGIPASAVRVIESGIAERNDIERLEPLGVDAYLIGGALLNAPDPGAKLRELHGGAPTAGERHTGSQEQGRA